MGLLSLSSLSLSSLSLLSLSSLPLISLSSLSHLSLISLSSLSHLSLPSPDQVGPLLSLPLKLLVPCFTPLSRPGWTFALPSSQVAGALLHPPLPTRLDLCSSFLSSCWCLAP